MAHNGYMDIPTAIRRTGLRQSEVAAKLGMSPSGLSKRTSGEVEWRVSELASLHRVLEQWLVPCEPADLIAAAEELRSRWLEEHAA